MRTIKGNRRKLRRKSPLREKKKRSGERIIEEKQFLHERNLGEKEDGKRCEKVEKWVRYIMLLAGLLNRTPGPSIA